MQRLVLIVRMLCRYALYRIVEVSWFLTVCFMHILDAKKTSAVSSGFFQQVRIVDVVKVKQDLTSESLYESFLHSHVLIERE